MVEFLEAVQTLVRRFPAKTDPGKERRPHKAAHFVVAADGAWLRRSYHVAYQAFDESVAEPARPLGHLFLDKLFQLTVPMPERDCAVALSYLDQMLRISSAEAGELQQEVRQAKQDLADHHGDEEAILKRLDSYTPQVKDLVAGDAALALAQPETRQRTNHSLQKFATMLHANPRSMKKFLNTYSMLRSVRTLEGNTVPTDALALWAILLVRWPTLAEHLAKDPDAADAILDPLWVNEVFP
ncbi:MAG: FxSxx-COOH system tetratricopeptide repeat protein, partial [Haloechinothrix sp.]